MNSKNKCINNQGKILQFQFISTDDELERACRHFQNKKVVAVDLEADSMHSFKEKICLIQMACAGRAFLIDPFEMIQIDPFLEVLEDHGILKIFHGSDFDIRSLDRDYGVRVNNLFDTEIACRFIGVKERGLGALLKTHFDVIVDKRFQKVNWAQRPLKQDMIEYSVNDVIYLERLCDRLTRKLDARSRFSWAKEEFELQAQVKYEYNNRPPLFKRFKGAGKMNNRTLAVLENLLSLRMEIAEEKDRPMFKVFSNLSLKLLAEEKPVSVNEMVTIKALSRRQADMHGGRCKKAIADALDLAHKDLPAYPKSFRPKKDKRIQTRIKLLKKMREQLSEVLDIEPGFLINNALIASIAANFPQARKQLVQIDGIRTWQVEAIGNDILAVLDKDR